MLQFQACSDNLGCALLCPRALRSAGKTAPQIAAAVHQAVCTRRALHPRCNSLRSGEAIASTVDEPLVDLAAVSPQLQWWAAGRLRRGPAANISQPHASLVSVGPKPRFFIFTCTTFQKRFNTLCRKHSGRTPGICARHAGLAGIVAADASADHLSMTQSEKAQRKTAQGTLAKPSEA